MVVLIVGSSAFTELKNGHVEVGIIVDHFPLVIQKILDILSLLLTIFFCSIVAYAFFSRMNFNITSSLLGIPYYPLKILLILGVFSWIIVAIQKIIIILTAKEYKKFEE